MKTTAAGILSVLFLTGFFPDEASAVWPFKNKKKGETIVESPVTEAVVSMYDKVILNAKDRTTVYDRAFKLHKTGDKLYLEVAEDNFGKDLLLSSCINRTGDLSMAEPGTQAMTPERYYFEKNDSVVFLKKPAYDIRIADGEENIARAMEMSRAGATVMTFPIECVNFDTTAVVFEATKLLYVSNRSLVDMTGKQLSGDFRVTSSRPDTKHAHITGIEAFPSGVAVSSETGLALEATGMMGFMILELEATVEITAYLTLLSEERMAPREADSRIGTDYIAYTQFSSGGTREGYFAKRLRLEAYGEPDENTGLYLPHKKIRIYVDTTFTASWYEAICEGILSWNRAFEEAGFRDVFQIEPYPSGEGFNADDPTVNTVRFGVGTGTSLTHRKLTDPRTGEIIAFSISVPRDYVQGLRRNAVYQISRTDPRYREYFLPEDAVLEGLRADFIRQAGFCFGLAPNYAGSYAYSPEQIRDPEFTREHGFTASVLDGVMFNYIARPGDRERGVATVIAAPGIYDRFAVKWLYSPLGAQEKETLDLWLREKEGQAEYLYVRPQSLRAPYDPRAFSKDLSCDIFAATDNLMETVKFVFANGHEWIGHEDIPADYKTLFPDYAILKFDDIILSLCNYVGGIYINETVESSGIPHYRPVEKELQKKALLKILSLFDDLSWADSNPRLMNMVGMDKRVSNYIRNNLPVRYLMLRIMGRNGAIGLSVAKSDDPYTQREALEGIAAYIFQDVGKGRQIDDGRFAMVKSYIDQLIYYTPLLNGNYQKNTASRRSVYPQITGCVNVESGEDYIYGAMGTIASFDYNIPQDNSALYLEKLKEARAYLVRGKQFCRTIYARDKYDYYITVIDMALKSPE
ncbi:MAG: zinc-dependent metalloprotease [Rikenellaceae bacterium]|nr:zinc-dependent metalloprotease [Rikenellaceae bacterium]